MAPLRQRMINDMTVHGLARERGPVRIAMSLGAPGFTVVFGLLFVVRTLCSRSRR